MKNMARKILCVMVAILFVLSLEGSIVSTALEASHEVRGMVSEEWLEYGEAQEVSGVKIWICPDEEEYYLTHGRYRNILDYLTLGEYNVFRETGIRLEEFLDLRASGMTLAKLAGDPDGYTHFDDLPISLERWLEHGEVQEVSGVKIWICPDEEEYYLTHGRYRNILDYLTLGEYNIFRETGIRLEEFLDLRASGMTLTELAGDPDGYKHFDDLPISLEKWLEYGETQEVSGVKIWICPDEEEYYLTHGRYRNILDYLTLGEYNVFRETGIRLEEFLGLRASGMTLAELAEDPDGYTHFDDLPISLERWLEHGETQKVWGVTTWACPYEEEYYLTHGRYRNILDYLTLGEYNVFRETGIRLEEFLGLRASGMTLTELAGDPDGYTHFDDLPISMERWLEYGETQEIWDVTTWVCPYKEEYYVTHGRYQNLLDYMNMAELAVDPDGYTHFDDLPISLEQWLEDDAIMPLSAGLPQLSVSRGTTTSTAVTVTGAITSTGGAPITARGFWIRRSDQLQHREVLVFTSSNTFTTTIPGLTPNSTYLVRAIARNSNSSNTGQSTAITFTTPPSINPPGAPLGLTTTPGINQVTLSWSAPASNGGAAITRYEVALNNGAWVTAQSMSQHTFSNLSTGQHTFRVRAVNSAGAGPQASRVASPIAASLPILTVSRGTTTSTTVTVTGNITNTGGATITARGFWVRRIDQPTHREVLVNTSSNTFTHTIPNLTPNSTYIVRAIARNNVAAGTGQSSEITFTTPANLPSAPLNFRSTPGTNQVTLNWSAPANNGGAAITRYEVSVNNGAWVTAQSMTQHTFTNLAAGQYTFRVRAVNSAGAGAQSTITASPSANLPILTVSRGTTTSTTVTVTGNIINTGGATITARGFWIRRIDQPTHREVLVNTSSNTFTHTIPNLTPNSTYIVRAIARNNVTAGTGQSSEITFTTPANLPGAPNILGTTPGTNQVTLHWSAPANNGGAAITRYEVSVNNGAWATAQSMTQHTFTNLAAGQHTFRVRAVNSAGAGAQSTITASPSPSANLPTLTVSRGTTTSTTVTVTGNIINTGGATITARGFWIRRSDQLQHREVLVNTSSNTFTHTIPNLTPNSIYIVRAIARNNGAAGTGQSSEIIFTTPANLPGAPLNFSATPGTNQVILHWTAPANNGGAAITRYEVSLNNETWVTAQGMAHHTFTNLAAGQHTFRVRAVNSAGAGPQAAITASPLPSVNLPTLTVSRGTTTSTTVTVTGNITNTGGATITARGFWIRRSDQPTHREVLVSTSSNTFTHTIPNLTPNSIYFVRAIARNNGAAGTGQSSEIIFITPANLPGVPLNFSATPGTNQVILHWTAPANNGGAGITRYEVSVNNGAWVTAQGMTHHTFTNLAAGQHTFRIRAVNSAGAGPQATITASPLPNPPAQTWWAITEPTSNTQFLMSTNRMAQVGPFSNVYMGVSRRVNASSGDAFVLSNTGWIHIGTAIFIQSINGQESPYVEIQPSQELEDYLGDARSLTVINIPNPGVGSLLPVPNLPTNVDLTNLMLYNLQHQVRNFGMTDATYRFALWVIQQVGNIAGILQTTSDIISHLFENELRNEFLGSAIGSQEIMRYFGLLHEVAIFSSNNSSDSINRRYQRNRNRLNNSPITGYIHRQSLPPQGTLEMGLTGNGADNGCGPFAIHNAMFYLDSERTVPDTAKILRDLEWLGGFNLGGMLGTNPTAIYRHLRTAGLNPTFTASPAASVLDTQIRNSAVSIFLYYGEEFDYIHYVMIRHDGSRFWIYNLSGDEPVDFQSISAWAPNTDRRPLALITLSPTPQIQTSTLSSGAVGMAYNQTLEATGGRINWSVFSGSLPPGLSLNASTGVISGTPTAPGLFSFGIRVLNRANQVYVRSFSIQINERIQIQTTHLPNASVGRFYSQTIQATGTRPITWGLESGSLPPGLGINRTTGAIVGTPTASGQFNFTVRATNPVGMVVHPFSIVVNNTQPQAYDTATTSVIDQSPYLVVLYNDDVVDSGNDIVVVWQP